jgi:hypothetical protein
MQPFLSWIYTYWGLATAARRKKKKEKKEKYAK